MVLCFFVLIGNYKLSKAMKKYIYLTISILSANLLFGVDKDYSYQNVSGLDFSNQDLSDARFSCTDAVDTNFSNANLTNAFFYDGYLTNANFTDAIVNGASFNSVYNFTEEQLKSTASYKNKDLSGIGLELVDVAGWDFSGQNLMNSTFFVYDFTNTNFTLADLRGGFADTYTFAGEDAVITKNTIWTDGVIKNLSMTTSDDNLLIRKYTPIGSAGSSFADSPVSAKIDQDATISGGATITLAQGAEFEIIDNAVLTFASDANLEINTDINNSTTFTVADGAGLIFEKGATLTINLVLSEDFSLEDDISFSVIKWSDASTVVGADAFEKGKDILLTINGEAFEGIWNFIVQNNQLIVTVSAIPEPAEWVAIFGTIALGVAVYRRRK